MLSDQQLLAFNQQGLIPGPGEDKDAFIKRAEACLNLKNSIAPYLKESMPSLEVEEKNDRFYLEEAYPITRSLFGIAPQWIPLVFSDDKLSPWHGAVAWIFQLEKGSSTGALLQLRKVWKTSSTHLKIYSRDELIAHELCHAGRMMFEEPKFEEILAYKTSQSAFRRWYGSIIESSKEASLFIFSLLVLVAVTLYAVFTDNDTIYRLSSWFQFFPLGLALLGILRLRRRHIQVDKCTDRLNEILKDDHKAQAVLYRLTDREIISFSKLKSDQIIDYMKANKEQSLRWHLLYIAYFQKNEKSPGEILRNSGYLGSFNGDKNLSANYKSELGKN